MYTHSGTEIVPMRMSAIAKDINSRLVVVRSRLLTRKAPITSEFPNTIITARMPKNTMATTSTWPGGGPPRGPPDPGPVPLVLFVRFVNVVLLNMLCLVFCRKRIGWVNWPIGNFYVRTMPHFGSAQTFCASRVVIYVRCSMIVQDPSKYSKARFGQLKIFTQQVKEV